MPSEPGREPRAVVRGPAPRAPRGGRGGADGRPPGRSTASATAFPRTRGWIPCFSPRWGVLGRVVRRAARGTKVASDAFALTPAPAITAPVTFRGAARRAACLLAV